MLPLTVLNMDYSTLLLSSLLRTVSDWKEEHPNGYLWDVWMDVLLGTAAGCRGLLIPVVCLF